MSDPQQPYRPYEERDGAGGDPYGRPDPYGPDPYQAGSSGLAPQPYPGYSSPGPDHPQGTLILVLGILGLLVAGILSPFAWVMGSRALRDIRATGSAPRNQNQIVAGRILGIIGTVLLVLAVVLGVLAVVLFAVAASSIQGG